MIHAFGTALMMAVAVGAYGQSQVLAPLDENTMALMQTYLRTTPLGDGLSAYPSGPSWLVPLGEICRQLMFAIEVDPEAGSAKGFFIRSERLFTLDLASRTAVSGGKTFTFGPEQVQSHNGDLYVDVRLLETWFPLKVQLEFRDSSLYISPSEKLPIEEAWDRDRTNARLLGKTGAAKDDQRPSQDYPYHFVSLPIVDLTVAAQRNSRGQNSKPQMSATLGGDLLWMSSRIYLSRDDQGSYQSSRATLFRDDPAGGLLGPLHARHVSVGDLQRNASLPLVGGLPEGRGVALDNQSLDFRTTFATRVFRGYLPPGWSVELFQNGGLVAFQQVRPDGTYELPPVNMIFGLNLFKLVFHGPYGELREENIRLDIGQEQPEPGAFYYRTAAVRPRLQPQGVDSTIHLLQQPVYFADGELGLTTNLSAQAGLMRLQYSDGTRTYASGGIRTVLPWVSVDLLGASSAFLPLDGSPSPRGKAAMLTARTGLGYSSLQVSHAAFWAGYRPIQELTVSQSNPLRSEDTLTLSSSLTLGQHPFSTSLNLRRQTFLHGARESQFLIVGTNFGRVAVNQSLGITNDTTGPTPSRSMSAQWMASTFMGLYSFQGELTAQKPQGASFKADTLALTAQRGFDSGVTLQMIARSPLSGGSSGLTWTTNLMQQQGTLGWGLNATWSKSGGVSAGVRLQASFGRDPRSRTWFRSAQPISGMGAVSARAFLDTDGDGKLDPGEKFLEEPRFTIGDSARDGVKADAHTALYPAIPAGRTVPLALDGASLEDPSLQPAEPYVTILPRPGVVMPVDYPVVVVGEVIGTVRIVRGQRTEELPGILVEIVDMAGGTVQVQRSAFDGFFEFRNLPLGQFQLRIPQTELVRLKLRLRASRDLNLEYGKALAEGQDLVVEPLHPVEEKAPVPPPLVPDTKDPEIRVIPPLQDTTSSLPSLPGIPARAPSALAAETTLVRKLVPPTLAPAPRASVIDYSKDAPFYRTTLTPRFTGRRYRRSVAKSSWTRPSPTQIKDARIVSRAVRTLLPDAYTPWVHSTKVYVDPVRRIAANPPRALPDRSRNVRNDWTILLLSARNRASVDVLRRRLGYLAKDLIVYSGTDRAPMLLLLGRYADQASAAKKLADLPAHMISFASAPSVIPFPHEGGPS